MTTGFVMFQLDTQIFVTPLDAVREIVRLGRLQRLPGGRPPLAGLIELRGTPLPVLDVRAAGATDDTGDVLVVEIAEDAVGVAVDKVLAVLGAEAVPEITDSPAKVLPPYVVGVRKSADGPVLLVDLQQMLDVAAEGWVQSLAAVTELAAAF